MAQAMSPAAPVLARRDRVHRRVEKGLLCAEIVWTYVEASWLLRRRRLQDAVAAMRNAARPHGRWSPVASEQDAAIRLGLIVRRTLAPAPKKSPCLTQSLVLAGLLARRGIPHKFVVGVRASPSFLAHAWVEHESRPLLPTGPVFGRILEL